MLTDLNLLATHLYHVLWPCCNRFSIRALRQPSSNLFFFLHCSTVDEQIFAGIFFYNCLAIKMSPQLKISSWSAGALKQRTSALTAWWCHLPFPFLNHWEFKTSRATDDILQKMKIKIKKKWVIKSGTSLQSAIMMTSPERQQINIMMYPDTSFQWNISCLKEHKHNWRNLLSVTAWRSCCKWYSGSRCGRDPTVCHAGQDSKY